MKKIPSTSLIFDDRSAHDLRAAGPAAMLIASFLKSKANCIGFFQVKPSDIAQAVGLTLAEVESVLLVLEKIGFLRSHAETTMC